MVVAASVAGVQPFRERFKHRNFEDAPAFAQWRSNLTGLSQIQNLYFVAYGSNIYVYVPQFPSQRLPEEPSLIFTSEPSAPHLSGYLDQGNAHAINNLIVKFLGNEEIVAVTRDDGDVDAFLTRHIAQAIARRAEPSNELGPLGDEVRPFFQSNVGMSAWGLDVHSQARILATSANTHEVRVFKFGLLQTDESNALDNEDEAFSDVDDVEPTKHNGRKTDVTYDIINGESNIPCISFCNTGDDPEGRWLLTTDISGVCRIMDLSELKLAETFRFGPSYLTANSGGFDRLNAGWIVTFLDRRSFQEEDSVDAALGLDEGEALPGIKRNPAIWNISHTVKRLPEYAEPFIHNRTKRKRIGRPSSGGNSLRDESTVDSAVTEGSEENPIHGSESDDSSDGGARIDIDVSDDGSPSENNPSGSYVQDTDQPEESPGETMSTGEWATDSDEDEISDSDPELVAFVDEDEDPEDETMMESVPFTRGQVGESILVGEPRFTRNDSDFWNKLPCPIIHASVRNIYLLQPFVTPTQQQKSVSVLWNPPMICLANPLRQAIQKDFEYLCVFERLNMTVSIPPLGIIIVASQKGRALVLSLTKIPASAKYPPEITQNSKKTSLSWINKTNYAMRVECIFPFVQQEKANQRPFAPLHGIAASPLQGCESSRWRIMMMYQDHSILSYEIGRKGGVAAENSSGNESAGMGVEVEELAV